MPSAVVGAATAITRGMTGKRAVVVAPALLLRGGSSPRATCRSLHCGGNWSPKCSSSSSLSSRCAPSSYHHRHHRVGAPPSFHCRHLGGARAFSSSSGGSGDGDDDDDDDGEGGGGGAEEEPEPEPEPDPIFRPRRMSRYGLDRIYSRAVRPPGPRNPMAINTSRLEPILLGDDDDDDDEYDDVHDEEGGGGGGGGGQHDGGKVLEPLPAYGSLLAKERDPLADLDADLTEENIGVFAAEALRHTLRERERGEPDRDDVEEFLREDADWFTSAPGSTEDLVGRRRALMYVDDVGGRRDFRAELARLSEEQRYEQLRLGEDDLPEDDDDDSSADSMGGFFGRRMDQEELEQEMVKEYDVKPHHLWSETVVRVDRVQKVQRGGTMVRYRCLIVGGNTRGAAGFGVGKANGPQEAAALASRLCKRNVHFVDRYLGSGITHDLVGKHNSCRVFLRAVPPGYGLKGSNLVEQILTSFGITDCSAKTHGNRNIYNVVRATFKAIATHESLEDIARKRGKRLINLERARRLQI